MKKNKKRLLSLMLVFALLFGSVGVTQAEEMTALPEDQTGSVEFQEQEKVEPEEEQEVSVESVAVEKKEADAKAKSATGLGATVTLQIEGYSYTVEEGVPVKMPDKYKTFADYGLTDVKEPAEPGFTVLHVMAEYCEQTYGKGTAPDLIQNNDTWIQGFMGLPEKSTLMFLINHESLNVGASEQKVKSGDLVSVVDVWANDNWTIGGQYAWFPQAHVEAEAEDVFTMQLKTTALMWGEASNPKGATIQVYDGNKLVTSGVTDVDGKVSLSIDTPGSYTVTAERRSTYYDIDGNYPYDLTRPHGTITIIPQREVLDEEAVRIAKDALSLGDISKVTSNITLPSSGNKKTTITWESDTPEALDSKGTVKRSYSEDVKVKLTATITRGSAKEKKEFEATVVAYSLKLKSLEITGSKIAFSPDETFYTVYVAKDAEKVEVTAEAQETFPNIWFYINGTCQWGNSKGTEKVAFPLDEESIKIPVEVKNKMDGDISSCTTILVKRAANIGEPLPDLPNITWGQHLGNKDNNAVVDAKTPTENGTLLWESFSNAPDNWGSVYAGTPILVNDCIYAVRNHKIEMLDAKTGKVKASTPLKSEVGFYSNITYGGGMIFVPLGNGMIDCFHAKTLKRMYLTEQPGGPLGGLSVYGSIHYDNGIIYVGYADWGDNGYYAAYDTIDTDKDNEDEIITPLWTTKEKVSYYGSGAVTTDDYVVIAGGDGKVTAVDRKTGQQVSSCEVQGMVRCALVKTDNYIWTTTQDGKIYKLSLNEEGKIKVAASADLPVGSNASPVVAGGKVYVTGGNFNDGGFFAVYDISLNKVAEIRTKGSLNTPTVTTAYDDIYVYFTENSEKGTLYMAKVTANNKISLTELYVPKHPQYSMCKVVVGSDGTLYYGNDAGYLYAIKQGKNSPVEKPDPGKDDQTKPSTNESQTASKLTTTVKKFTPVKRKINATTKKNKSQSERIADAIEHIADKGETSFTVKNVPDKLGKEVFEALKKSPDFRLVLDCGTYTISLKGSDVTNPQASLNTRLIEMEGALSEKDVKALGSYQQIALVQEGAFPGKVTVVYKLPEQLTGAEQLYLYSITELTKAQKVVLDSGYAMFVLDSPGEYVLSDKKAESVEEIETQTDESVKNLLPEQAQKDSLPTGFLVLLGVAGGLIAGGIVGGAVASRKRKREDTWER